MRDATEIPASKLLEEVKFVLESGSEIERKAVTGTITVLADSIRTLQKLVVLEGIAEQERRLTNG